MKTRFIFNPRSGLNAGSTRLADRIQDFITRHGMEATVVPTVRPGHATELAAAAVADGCGCVAAVGGDGTMNEVARALVGTETAFGLVPCGSGNGLGRHLGIADWQAGLRAVLVGQSRLMDTGSVNGHPFFNVMGAGFDAEIAERFSRLEARGFRSYVRTTLRAFAEYKPVRGRVEVGGRAFEVEAFLLSVANSDQYGNNCYIAPGACVDDGLLDLTVIRPVGVWRALPLACRLFMGSVAAARGVQCVRAERFAITLERACTLHVDGEPLAPTARIEVAVRPASLRVITPAQPSQQ